MDRRSFFRTLVAGAATGVVSRGCTLAPQAPSLNDVYPHVYERVTFSVDMFYGGDVVRPELATRIIDVEVLL